MQTEKERYLAWIKQEQDQNGLMDVKFMLTVASSVSDEEDVYREANLINKLHEQGKQIHRPDVV